METTFNCMQDDLNVGGLGGVIVPMKSHATYKGFGTADPNTVQITYEGEPMIQIQRQGDDSYNIAIDGLNRAAVTRFMFNFAGMEYDGAPPGLMIRGGIPPLPEGG